YRIRSPRMVIAINIMTLVICVVTVFNLVEFYIISEIQHTWSMAFYDFDILFIAGCALLVGVLFLMSGLKVVRRIRRSLSYKSGSSDIK
ncbi:hypothetical protein KIPB_015469, partial [Kipferlia bialata]